MRALLLDAIGVERKRVIVQCETPLGSDAILAPLDFGIVKLLDPAALQANQMVVVRPFVEFENRPAGFEMMALQETRLLELGQDPVYGREANLDALGQQLPIHIFGTHVPYSAGLEKFQDTQSRTGRFETDIAQAIRVLGGHGLGGKAGLRHGRAAFVLARERKASDAFVGLRKIGGRHCHAPRCHNPLKYHTGFGRSAPPTAPKFPLHNCPNVSSRLALTWVLTLLTVGCASDSSMQRYVPQIVTPYRMDIQQGNFVTQDMVDKLAVGQTRDQVRFILGTPLLTDVFHANRWDYVFRFSRGWNQPERRRLVIYFDADSRVAKWDADVPPPAPAAGDAGTKPGVSSPADPPEPASPASGANAGEAASPGSGQAVAAAPPTAAVAGPAIAPPATQPGVSAPPAAAVVPAVPPESPPSAPSPVAPALATGSGSTPAVVAEIDRKISAASPAPAPAPLSATANAAPRDVLAALEEWRAAWSARDADRYLSMYAPTFKPAAGMARGKWEQLRRERLKRASFVVVKVVDPQVTVAGSDAAAIFTQVYESDTIKESGRKKLAMVLVGDGKWRIREEIFEK